jgi:hypothetical protein
MLISHNILKESTDMTINLEMLKNKAKELHSGIAYGKQKPCLTRWLVLQN